MKEKCEIIGEEKDISIYLNRVKYMKWYDSLIDKFIKLDIKKNDKIYTEVHHILPRCMGGKNNKINLVRLPIREHIMAHLLLTKIYPKDKKIALASCAMLMGKERVKLLKSFSTRTIADIRIKASKLISGNLHHSYGKVRSEETKRKISEALLGKITTDETKEKLRKINIGKKISHKVREKMRNGQKNRTYEYRKQISDRNKGSNNPSAKSVIGPDGTKFDTLNDAAKKINVHRKTLRKWIKNKPEKGWSFYETTPKKIISPEGMIYSDLKNAADSININDRTLYKWIKNKPELGWKFYIEPDSESDS